MCHIYCWSKELQQKNKSLGINWSKLIYLLVVSSLLVSYEDTARFIKGGTREGEIMFNLKRGDNYR